MKKLLILFVSVVMLSQITIAQNDTLDSHKSGIIVNKRGDPIGPENGDWALGIDASPFLEYVGNILKISDEANPAPTFGFTAQNPGQIYIKRMTSQTDAMGLAFRIGATTKTQKDGSGFSDDETDKYITSALNLGLTFSLEKSPFMKSRLRGFYGWHATAGLAPYTGVLYGNIGQVVVGKYKFVDATSDSNNFVEKGGNTISLGGGGFVGMEYFIAPKISLSGRFSLTLAGGYQLKRKYIPETGSEVTVDAGGWSFMLDNLASGSLALIGYF